MRLNRGKERERGKGGMFKLTTWGCVCKGVLVYLRSSFSAVVMERRVDDGIEKCANRR